MIEGKEVRIEIIESKNKNEFGEMINEVINNGGTPLFETFNVTNYQGVSQKGTARLMEKYYILVKHENE